MKHFISFLGTNDYKPCQYRHGNETSPEVTYVQTATCSFKQCDKATVFCTACAKQTHADKLVAEFKRHALPDVSIVDIPNGASEKELWEIFRKVRDKVNEDDEIVFDVTHSFRSLPVIMTVLLRYLAVVKKVVLNACLYGAWEARDGDCTPIFDLTPFFTLDDWTHAILDFEHSGNPSGLEKLARAQLGPLCRTDESARRLNAAVKTLAQFSRNVRVSNLGFDGGTDGIRTMPIRSSVVETLSTPGIVGGIPELEPVLQRLKDSFSMYGDIDVRNGFRAARWAAEHGLIPQAYTLLQETTVSVVLEQYRKLLPDGLRCIAAREFVSGVLAKASDPNFDWKSWNKSEGSSEIAQKLAETLNKDLVSAYATLTKRRNAINHAGTNNQEPITPNSPNYQCGGFDEIAKTIEDALCKECAK